MKRGREIKEGEREIKREKKGEQKNSTIIL